MENISEKLKSFNDFKLMDIVKNYKQYRYDVSIRDSAISILESRGISENELKMTGNYRNSEYDIAENIYKAFLRNSKLTFLFYGLFIIFFGLTILIGLWFKADSIATFFSILMITSLIIYILFLILTFSNQFQLDKVLGKNFAVDSIIITWLLGIPFYFLTYFYLKDKMKETMNLMR
jgi:lipopolysaccharide export system permease protein